MNNNTKIFSALLFITLLLPLTLQAAKSLPDGFVYMDDIIPGVKLEIRYFTDNNFTGHRVDGYLKPRCIATKQVAQMLKKVQEELKPFGLEIKIFDAYRPQMAVDNFVRWASDLNDTKMKKQYYPDVDKSNLFKSGYIASKSGHTRGSAVDLTIIESATGKELDMGGTFDFFGPVSWPESDLIAIDKRANRLLLRALMTKDGFNCYQFEWWHFSLANEPFPDTYFNFPVE